MFEYKLFISYYYWSVCPSITTGAGVLGLVWRKPSRRPVQCTTTAGRDGTSRREGGTEGRIREKREESGRILGIVNMWERMGAISHLRRPLPLWFALAFTCPCSALLANTYCCPVRPLPLPGPPQLQLVVAPVLSLVLQTFWSCLALNQPSHFCVNFAHLFFARFLLALAGTNWHLLLFNQKQVRGATLAKGRQSLQRFWCNHGNSVHCHHISYFFLRPLARLQESQLFTWLFISAEFPLPPLLLVLSSYFVEISFSILLVFFAKYRLECLPLPK